MATFLPTRLPFAAARLAIALPLLLTLCLAASLVLLVSPAADAAVFVVNTTLDGADGVPGDGACDFSPVPPPSGLCSLRAAVEEANALGGAHEIRFNVGGGGLQTLDVNGPSPIEITTAVTIRGETQPGFADDPMIHLHFDGGGAIPGLSVTGAGVTVRSLRISGFTLDGISLTGFGTEVEGCWIGLDDTGAADSNLRGLGIAGSSHLIGGGAFPNVISGNFDGGVVIGATASNVTVEANRIGTDADGLVALGNGNASPGVRIDGSMNTVEGNLISGNKNVGVWITGDENLVTSNVIGLSEADAPLGNGFAGVFVAEGADDNVIGGTTIFERNVISGNMENDFGQGGSGIFVAGAARTSILGNYIGTDSSGTLDRGNELHGVHISQGGTTQSSETLVGVFDPATSGGGNVISANGNGVLGGHGVFVELSDLTTIAANRIGIGAGGVPSVLPNQGDGIRVVESLSSLIGGPPVFGPGPNTITQNDGAGVAILDPDAGAGSQNTHGHHINMNSIWQNGGLAIDLTLGALVNDGATANDSGDGDHGPNRMQNFPLITSVNYNAGTGETTVSGTLNSTSNTAFRVHVYDNDECEMPTFQGHAQTLVGEDFVNTNGSGNAAFSIVTTSPVTYPAAVAIVDDGDPSLADTSEVSPCDTGLGAAGILGDFVWLDVNGNGLQDLDESGVEGVIVRLFDDLGGLVAETETNAEGFYRFTGLASDTYELEFDATDFTTPDVGADDEIDSDVTVLDRTDPFAYTAGTVDLSRDAGLAIQSSIFEDGFESGDTSRWSVVVN